MGDGIRGPPPQAPPAAAHELQNLRQSPLSGPRRSPAAKRGTGPMANQSNQATGNAPQAEGGQLRGGTQGGEAARTIDESIKGSGTPGVASRAGGVHTGQVSQTESVTGLG